jgi:hypothetical protein
MVSRKLDFGARTNHAYMLCGWHTHSDIPLTSVPTTSMLPSENVDVRIQIEPGRSPIARDKGGGVLEHSGEGWLIKIPSIADFEVIRGRQISVWPSAGATHKDIEIFLLGLAWATLCHQRGLLPLHASAITTKRGITAFAGHSGAGKSTMAALLSSLGYRLVADDILPISLNYSSIAGAWPYLRRLKLHGDLIKKFALTPTEVVSEILDKEKYFVPPKCPAIDQWTKLDRIYLLDTGAINSPPSIDRVTGAEAIRALIDQTFHFAFIVGRGEYRKHLSFCTQLASTIPVYRLRGRQSFGGEEELSSTICAHLEEVPT